MRVELRDPLERLFADDAVGRRPRRALELDVARGGTVAAHLLCSGLRRGERVALSALVNGRPARRARWFRLLAVPVEENTGIRNFTESARPGERNPHVVRRAPFRTFDAMEPIGADSRAESPVEAFRLELPVPRDARPGALRCAIEVRAGGTCEPLALVARVHRATIPPAGADSFPYTNWFSYDNIAARHGLRKWSEPHWRMLRRYAELMRRGRQNTFWIPLQEVFERRAGRLVLDRARLRRIVATFTAAGLHFIEGGHVGTRIGGEWKAVGFDLVMKGPRGTSAEGNAVLAGMLGQLMAEIERCGWRRRWLQHVADEPVKENATDYRILVGMVRKYMPGIPVLDALMDTELAGSADIWCPQVHEYQHSRAAFERQRAVGDRIWYYTCCSPGGPWLNRLLDQELLRPVLLAWGGALFGLDGFLHWGLNHYRADQDPFRKSVVGHGGVNSLPAGDTHIVYPGKDGPWSSLRLEAHREGFEDLELLRQLQARNPRRARAVLAMAVRGFDKYVKDVGRFRAARRALLESL
ncbi:MAG TPA: DUF4091 domain-containing protein [Planctomycetota bacterium]|nr:DUF4091 domain-containing protein [Planctomycetota bacterium]